MEALVIGLSRRWLALLAIVSFVIALTATDVRQVAADDPAHAAHEQLKLRRAAGDREAARLLARLDAFLARSGKSFDQAKNINVPDVLSTGAAPAHVAALPPFYVKVYNTQKLRSEGEIQRYVGARSAALAALAHRDASAPITVALSPEGHMSLDQLLRLRDTHDIDLLEVSLDVVIDGRWDRMIWGREDDTLGLRLEFSASAADIRAQLLQPMLAARGADLALERAVFELRYAVGRIRAADATALRADPAILLVDPFDDLLEKVAGAAASVRVAHMPQPYVQRMLNRADFYPVRRATMYPPSRGPVMTVGRSPGLAAVSAVDGWKAWDHEYNDDPDNVSKDWGPAGSVTHNQGWYDFDTNQTCDQVRDEEMIWTTTNITWWQSHLSDNWALSERVHRDLYEWDELYWTDMPSLDHNEDDEEIEEPTNPWPYDEKEVGSSRPETFVAGAHYYIQTNACPLAFDGSGYIYSSSEWADWLWRPICCIDELGYLFAAGTW
jgi:hypothetical protein